MDVARQREQKRQINDSKKNEFIVKTKKNIFLEILITLFTIIMWIYTLAVISMFFSSIFNYNNYYISVAKMVMGVNSQGIRKFICMSIIIFIIVFIILFAWRTYNKLRFGKLNRRKEPFPTLDEDILNLNLMKKEDYMYLKNRKRTIFYTNPIVDIKEEGRYNEKNNKN